MHLPASALLPLLLSLASPTLATTAPIKEPPAPTYAPCGGFRATRPLRCAEGYMCVDDPRKDGCGKACKDTGICVPRGLEMCGGFAGFECPEGLICIDDPWDDCSVEEGWADCAGICV